MSPADPDAPGSGTTGSGAPGADALGAMPIGSEAIGSEAIGSEAAGSEATDSEAPGSNSAEAGASDGVLHALSDHLGAALTARGWRVATAESCTGGWIAKALTDIPGSSGWFGSGFVTYSNEAKAQMLDVPASLIASHGAVSEPVVRAMAEGARRKSAAEVALAVSGVAGPGGGTDETPVGLVWFAWASPDGTRAERRRFDGGREAVRRASVEHALRGLLASVAQSGDRP